MILTHLNFSTSFLTAKMRVASKWFAVSLLLPTLAFVGAVILS